MRFLALTALLVGCDTVDTMPIEQAAPPAFMSTTDLLPGQPVDLLTTGANPGDRVWFLATTQGVTARYCPPALGGGCLFLDTPRRLGSAVADASGQARLSVTVPASLAIGELVWFQSAIPGAQGYTSNAITREVLDPQCPVQIQDFEDESDAIRACSTAAECGQVLTGTSCGCTRDWVARIGADTTDFYALLGDAASCGVSLDGPCDCPQASGFDCVANQCTWNYAAP